MKFTDIIDLAKAGYSPKDIKDLLSLTAQEPEPDKEPAPEPVPEDDKDKIIEDLKRQIAENEKKLETPEEPEPDPRDAEIEALKQKLAAFQEAETKKDISGQTQKTDEEIVKDAMRKFM